MHLTPVLCSQCGAPLEVPDDVNFVACGHCHVALAVKREAHIAYTQVVANLDRRTQHLARQIAELRYEQALAGIDRQWEDYQAATVFRGKHGETYAPSRLLAALAVCAWATILIFIGYAVVQSGAPQGWWLFGAVAVLGGLIVWHLWRHASAYRYAELYYAPQKAKLKVEDFLPPE